MATIITKNSSTASAVPAAGSLVQGELAVNVTDKKLYTKDSGGNVVGVGQEPLISGTNIKTVNSNSLLGSGNVTVGDVTGPASSVSANIATFNGATGKIIQDGGKALPTGAVVGTTDTQTLTNKTLNSVVLNDGYTEEVFSVTGTTPALSPANGSIQTWTLTGNSTPTSGTWNAGQSITLMVDDGTAYTITWTSLAVTWKTNNGSAPTLNTTGFTVIQLWKVGSVIYGARVGDA